MITRLAAVDIGNYSVKARFDDHTVQIPNVIADEVDERNIVSLENEPLDGLHVSIVSGALKKGKGTYAVGKLAADYAENNELTPSDDKALSDQGLVLLLTTLALDAVEHFADDHGVVEARYLLSTGLPLKEVRNKLRSTFQERLEKNHHEITFLDTPKFSGKKVRISFERALVGSEGYAAMIELVTDDEGNTRNEELSSAFVLIHDIGGLSTDSAIIKPNCIIDNVHSDGMRLGVSPYLDTIIDRVDNEYRYRFHSRLGLLRVITSESNRFHIHVRGNRTNIKPIVDEILYPLAQEEYKQIRKLWSAVPEIQYAFLIGGGSILLREYLEQINHNEDNYPLRFLESNESIWAIANAYYKLGMAEQLHGAK